MAFRLIIYVLLVDKGCVLLLQRFGIIEFLNASSVSVLVYIPFFVYLLAV